jgi:hypothetical protein
MMAHDSCNNATKIGGSLGKVSQRKLKECNGSAKRNNNTVIQIQELSFL